MAVSAKDSARAPSYVARDSNVMSWVGNWRLKGEGRGKDGEAQQ